MSIPPRLNPTNYSELFKSGKFKISDEQIWCEMQLAAFGNIAPLSVTINKEQFLNEIKSFDNDWIDYLPRTDRVNNRKGLALVTHPELAHNDVLSGPEIRKQLAREYSELELNHKTSLYHSLSSLHPILNLFPSLSRTFLVKSNMGGYFVPHRDHPQLNREVFRIICFISNCKQHEYNFILEQNILNIDESRCYYVDTRKTHSSFSYVDDSIHLIINVPMTMENVLIVLSNLQHRH
jgi:hypothetical protein